MSIFLRDWARRALVLILLLFGTGCSGIIPSQPTASPPVADLTTNEIRVKVIRAGSSEIELDKDKTEGIRVDDRISLDTGGQGVVRFQERLEVDLYPNSEIRLVEFTPESGGSTSVRLEQAQGHSQIRLNEESPLQVTLETDIGTIKTREDGTQFITCHAPKELTCIYVRTGSVEVTAQGKRETIRAGEATFITLDQPPPPAFCAREEEVDVWLKQLQDGQAVPALGELVVSWPKEPCPLVAQETPGPEVTQPPDTAGMVRIEAGRYIVGSPKPDDWHIAAREIELADFWIDQYEVTNAQYGQFLEATGQQPPTTWPGEADHPVKGVTWDAAAAYCAWVNKRLPAEAEWEAAGRGPGPTPPLYPWGNDDPQAGGLVDDLPRDETYPVGLFPFNQSPFGVYDLAGNVWEWVDRPYEPVAEGSRILRGGRHGYIRDLAFRQPASPDFPRFVDLAGFRCAAGQAEGG